MVRRSGSSTISEVARHAGVSPATVSRVMNGRFAGEPEVAERVLASAHTLEYQPNQLARALALGQTKAVAFLVPDLANPTFQAVLSGFSKTAARDGYRALVADSAESPDDEALLATEIRRRSDAIVLCAPRMPEKELVALAEALQPLVLINRPSALVSAPSLSVDYQSGIQALARHLYDLGHRRFALVMGPEQSVSNAARLRGFEEFRQAADGVTVSNVRGGAGLDDGSSAAQAVRETGATAVLAFNDLVAIGLINGLQELGVDVPGEISVTGFDDIPFARFCAPPLTTASVPHEDLGVEAWQRLHSLIQEERPSHNLVFQPRVEVRGSAGPVRS
ncbi:LacI family transcriptional regulator [Leifsonia sp. Root227]|uniref:LacI family DNA-binding transcriptional regulator n=1 Tax=unclassified Leifsonia TaxID=2663824 RepID=UPI0006F6A77A|nr:LacI family DNA-binding transcriptional regulator [Leifsonia sp. Root227]KRC50759.1 LacI family transcriptional regulator [Leifsonia sp. Root227]